MDNNELYVNEEIVEYLKTKEEMKELDEVTVKSLFRTCIESVNPELPRSSIIIKDNKNTESVISVSFKNIKFNLDFALDMILGIGAAFGSSQQLMIFQVLDVLRTFFTHATIELEKEDAYLIYLIHKLDYKKTGVSKEQIENYIQNDPIAKEKKYFSNPGEIEQSFERLMATRSIICENDEYSVTETILG